MFVSKQLKEKNIAEYLIYMWQIEDLIRANGCDMEKIKSTTIAPYPLTEEQKAEPVPTVKAIRHQLCWKYLIRNRIPLSMITSWM